MCDECSGGEHNSGSLPIAVTESFFKESLSAPKSSRQFIINYGAVDPHQHHFIGFSSFSSFPLFQVNIGNTCSRNLCVLCPNKVKFFYF